ncbi:MAG: hypothetical protein K5829_15815 [Treponema sp.]|nr:hypothetical protein [Treponema sp.]
MIKKVQIFLIGGILFFILLIVASLGILAIKNNKASIAFYNIEASTQEAILSILNSDYKIITLDSSKTLSSQEKDFKNSTFLFAQLDYDIMEFCNTSSKVKALSTDYLNGMPSSIVASVPETKDKIKYLPLLYDFYQIDVNFQAFKTFSKENSNQNIDYWDDYIDFLTFYSRQDRNPLIFEGKDPYTNLAIIGMLTEALSSKNDAAADAYSDFCEDLYSAFKKDYSTKDDSSNDFKNLSELLEKECAEGGLLSDAIKEFAQMINANIIPSGIFNFTNEELNFYLENKISLSAIYKLSNHRQLNRSIINNFSTIYCPSKSDRSIRKFEAPVICAIMLKKNEQSTKELADLSNNRQTQLSTKSGLAPVQKNCSVADIQADDVRYWLAASNGPLLPLYAALPSKEAVEYCSDFIIEKIRQIIFS